MITVNDLDKISLQHNEMENEFLLFDKTEVAPNNKIGWIYYSNNWNGNPEYIELTLLKINEKYKRKGFGKFLITNFIEFFKNLEEYKRIYILAEPFGNNSTLRRQLPELKIWYEKFGFEHTDDIFDTMYLDLK